MVQWWMDLSPLVRAGCSLLLIGISSLLYFVMDIFWPYGWAVGGIMLALSFPSKKTHDWGDW